MATLNGQKQLLLNQVKNQVNIPLDQLVSLVKKYDDLSPNDFKGYIPELLFQQLLDALRDPIEVALWNQIQSAPTSTAVDIENALRLISTYLSQYPNGDKRSEAETLRTELQKKLEIKIREEREWRDWEMLEKGNYNALLAYKRKYPNSIHLDELDDLMWMNTKNAISERNLRRYLGDWPMGHHADEAQTALNDIAGWEAVKRTRDLFQVDDYRDNHPNSIFVSEIESLYYELRDEELGKMRKNPSDYGVDFVLKLIQADIFKDYELIDEGLMTEESWEKARASREYLPNIQEYQQESPNLQAPEGCTDVYLFGTPGTGKTCLLMGLLGANGSGYSINMKTNGGPYAAALQQYVQEGITPGRTFGNFVTTISGEVNEEGKRGNVISHRINLVEMSGEEFALRIADNKEVSLSNMGTGTTNLLKNNNRKVFFIIVDSSKPKVKVEYLEEKRDAEGNLVDQRIRKKYLSQLDIMNKFVSLFTLPENQDIMSKVDAIHFVVTKADLLGDTSTRLENAHKLLTSMYGGPIEQLKSYCRKTKRINYSTNYRPQVFTFSLGRFYLCDIFDFDKTETLRIIDTIRIVTGGMKEASWWDRFISKIGD